MAGEIVVVLTDSRRERYAKVAVNVDFANCHLRSLAKFAFGDTDSVGHVTAELVYDSNFVLGNGRCTVQNDREAGQSVADFFQDIQTKLGILTGLKFVSAVGRTDCDCKGVDTRLANEFLYFVRGRELRVSRVYVYVVFSPCRIPVSSQASTAPAQP